MSKISIGFCLATFGALSTVRLRATIRWEGFQLRFLRLPTNEERSDGRTGRAREEFEGQSPWPIRNDETPSVKTGLGILSSSSATLRGLWRQLTAWDHPLP